MIYFKKSKTRTHDIFLKRVIIYSRGVKGTLTCVANWAGYWINRNSGIYNK